MKKDDSITNNAHFFFWMAAFNKYFLSKFLISARTPPAPLSPGPTQPTFALVSYAPRPALLPLPPPFSKKVHDNYEFPNGKSGVKSGKKNSFFVISA